MRYRARGLTIRSENAAKPASQTNQQVLGWIADSKKTYRALDYGCGKLRYSEHLFQRCDQLTLVDSDVQLTRRQKIRGETTTIRQYVADRWPSARVFSIEEFNKDRGKYGLILCANVLSAIPSGAIRRRAVDQLARSLTRDGRCLFAVQYRNSYFEAVKERGATLTHFDGWIARARRGNFFYGIIPPKKLDALLTGSGFHVVESWVNGGSAYVVCSV